MRIGPDAVTLASVSGPPPNEKLEGLVAMLGDAEARELVRIYLSSVPKLVAEMAGEDRVRVRRAAHTLKSSSLQMGAADLSAHARELERRLDEGSPLPDAIELKLFQGQVRSVERQLRPFAGPE